MDNSTDIRLSAIARANHNSYRDVKNKVSYQTWFFLHEKIATVPFIGERVIFGFEYS